MNPLLDGLIKIGALLAIALALWAGAELLREVRLTLEREQGARDELARERAWRELRDRLRRDAERTDA